MPSHTQKQHNAMAAAAHMPTQEGGIPPSVAKEFIAADKGGKFDKGGYSRKHVVNALRRK